MADRLGGEERLEHAGQHLGAHAAAGIGQAKADVAASGKVAHLALAQLGVAGFQQQRAAVGHRVTGIDDQVEQSAFQLVLVAGDRPQAGLQLVADLDMAAQRAAEQVVHRFDQLIEFDALEVQWLTPGEGEQAVGQCRGAVGRGHRGIDEALGFAVPA